MALGLPPGSLIWCVWMLTVGPVVRIMDLEVIIVNTATQLHPASTRKAKAALVCAVLWLGAVLFAHIGAHRVVAGNANEQRAPSESAPEEEANFGEAERALHRVRGHHRTHAERIAVHARSVPMLAQDARNQAYIGASAANVQVPIFILNQVFLN